MGYSLLIGLGNPGEDYKNTYHNIGFLFLDRIAAENKFKVYKNFEYVKIGDAVVIKPRTFMNESGEAVKSALKHFKKDGNDILVIHDDSDIEFGKYKLSVSRGSAGHKGVESIMEKLGSKKFARLRVGVRKETGAGREKADMPRRSLRREARIKAGRFVLKKMGVRNLKILYNLTDKLRTELL